MKNFTLNTIQQGRLNDINMNKIFGGDVSCPVHKVSECMSAVRGTYTTCSDSAVTYENCSSLGYESCERKFEVCSGWG